MQHMKFAKVSHLRSSQKFARALLAAASLVVVGVSCTRLTAPKPIIEPGNFQLTLHLSADTAVSGVSEFNSELPGGVTTYLLTMASGEPQFELELRRVGVRPDADEYEVSNEGVEGAFTGVFRIGGGDTEQVEYQMVSGNIEFISSSLNSMRGSLDIDGIAINGPIPNRRINISGIFQASCFVNCPPSTGSGPS